MDDFLKHFFLIFLAKFEDVFREEEEWSDHFMKISKENVEICKEK